ncbi:MAG TPA: universal stress protein [Dissulfurispiraceae bacterium]|nr:universal stress protein [Dissulfurispiraceae bacterium]
MDIDMIVMGARGKSFFEGLMLGSVSESIIRSSHCPVFIVH